MEDRRAGLRHPLGADRMLAAAPLFLMNRRAYYGSGLIEEVAAGIIARSGLV